MDLVENLLRDCAMAVLGSAIVHYQGADYDIGQPFVRQTMSDAVAARNPELDRARLNDREYLAQAVVAKGVKVDAAMGAGKLLTELFEKTVESKLLQPTFITEYPTEVSPLARRSDANPDVTDRFEFFLAGREVANGFSELNDPDDQAARFRQQVTAKDAGDDEAMLFDAEYIRALEYGLPANCGCRHRHRPLGDVPDRFAVVRDVLLFPQMRPEA